MKLSLDEYCLVLMFFFKEIVDFGSLHFYYIKKGELLILGLRKNK